MNAQELKNLSDRTFLDNDEGLIEPSAHRNFNDKTIDYIVSGYPATFVIDSDTALTAWANNTAGNNYTHVLIKPGTYTCNTTIVLSRVGTKTVIGMGGSLLRFSVYSGISNTYDNKDIFLFGVNIETLENSNSYAFTNCYNLINCTGKTTASSGLNAASFSGCGNLIGCTGHATSTGSTNAHAFLNCKNITNCTGYANAPAGKNAKVFEKCSYLINCTAEATGVGNTTGFNTCTTLTDCYSVATGTATATGFNSCKEIKGSSGYGISSGSTGYAFANCNRLLFCKPATPSTTATYVNCYMEALGNGTPVSGTAEGGFNI